jgi:hypothetical protein
MADPLRKASIWELIFEFTKRIGYKTGVDKANGRLEFKVIAEPGKEQEAMASAELLGWALLRVANSSTDQRSKASEYLFTRAMALPPAKRGDEKERARIALDLLCSDVPLDSVDRAQIAAICKAAIWPNDRADVHSQGLGYLMQLRMFQDRGMSAKDAEEKVAAGAGLKSVEALKQRINRYLHPK